MLMRPILTKFLFRMGGLSPLVLEQVAVVACLLAYLTGLVTVRPRPAQQPQDVLARQVLPCIRGIKKEQV